jgi:hypothetical protein
MTLNDLASLATVISSAAVLASVVYLALQTRQATRHTRATIQQASMMRILENIREHSIDPDMAPIWWRGSRGDPDMAAPELGRFLSATMRDWMLMQDQFHQHRAGLIDDANYQITVREAQARLTMPGHRVAWRFSHSQFDPEFQRFIEGLMPDTPQPWRAIDMPALWRKGLSSDLAKTEKPA